MDTVHIDVVTIDHRMARAALQRSVQDDSDAGGAGMAIAASRTTYRHGDLRRALLDAGVELARSGGPEAVVLREATRRAGVAPNAAYRHFASRLDLLVAVRMVAVAEVAKAMEAELARVSRRGAPLTQARARVRAIGAGYLRYARGEPGLFRTAFGSHFQVQRPVQLAGSEYSAHNPFAHLSQALDDLVAAGGLPRARRPGAEYLAWSTVHGLALLVLDGPLSELDAAQVDALSTQLLAMVERGL